MWKGEWKFYAFIWPGGWILLAVIGVILSVWLSGR